VKGMEAAKKLRQKRNEKAKKLRARRKK